MLKDRHGLITAGGGSGGVNFTSGYSLDAKKLHADDRLNYCQVAIADSSFHAGSCTSLKS